MSTYDINDYVFSKSIYEGFYISSITWNPTHIHEEYKLYSLKVGYMCVVSKTQLDSDYFLLSSKRVYAPKQGSGLAYDVIVSYYDAVNHTIAVKNTLGVITNVDPQTFFNSYEEKTGAINSGWTQYTPTGHHIPPRFKINDVVALEINGSPFSLAISDVDLSKYQYGVTYDSAAVASNINIFKTGRIDIFLLDFIFAYNNPQVATKPIHVTMNTFLPSSSNFQLPDLTGKFYRLSEDAKVNADGHSCENNWTMYHGFTETYEYCKICDKRK